MGKLAFANLWKHTDGLARHHPIALKMIIRLHIMRLNRVQF